jgi:hypothetical protein
MRSRPDTASRAAKASVAIIDPNPVRRANMKLLRLGGVF